MIGPRCEERFLPYRGLALEALRTAGVRFSGLSQLYPPYRIRRRHCPLHLIFYTLGGSGWLKTSGYDGLLEPGTVWISPQGSWQMYGIQGKTWRILWFTLEDCEPWTGLGDAGCCVRPSLLGSQVERITMNIFDELGRTGGHEPGVMDLYSSLILHLLRRETATAAAQPHTAHRHKFELLRKFLNERLSEHWTVAGMSAAAGLHCSDTHFSHLCRHYLGDTPMQVLARLRLQRAAEILESTDYPLKRIADLTGYANPYILSNAFKRHFKCSPRDYRRRWFAESDVPGATATQG